MIKKPYKIQGDKIFDNRGSLSFVNSFGFKGVKRFYLIQNHQKNFIRAWHAHKKEEKYFFCIEGSCQISCVEVNNFKNPSKNSKIYKWVLSDQKPEIVFIPKGYANGSMNFSIDTKILVFSSSTLQQSASDDYRYPFDYWNPWSIIKR
jgi:dTDP-4-dehydrorhamnose 3,5-epimerase